jgi:hypothetical protein
MAARVRSPEANRKRTGAAYFNNVKKYVASTTLTDPEWNNTEVLRGDLVEEVAKLKAQDGRDILMYGYGVVTHPHASVIDRLVGRCDGLRTGSGGPSP